MARHRKMRVEPLEDRRMLAVSFTGGSYSQNFDTLPTSSTSQPWTNDATLEGWHLFRQPAPGIAVTTLNADQGSQITFRSLGSSPVTERALGGSVQSHLTNDPPEGAVAGWIALALDNDTGATINQLRLSYRGEQWFTSFNGGLQSLTLEYGFGSSFQFVPSWMPLDSQFYFTKGPAPTPQTGSIDGNQPGNYNNISGIIEGLSWTAGSTLWIRWVETNDVYFDHLLAIDNVEIATIPTVVDTLVDENDGDYSAGDLSLREALAIAIPGSTIEFDPSLTSGGPASIVLTQGELVIDKNIVIDGPGANLLSIDASGNDPTPESDNNDGSGIFSGDGDFGNYLSITLSGLTLTGADALGEGTVIGGNENWTIQSCKVTGNHGGTMIAAGYGDVVIADSEITNNSGTSMVSTSEDLEINNTIISNNTGRAITAATFYGGELLVTNSQITGNTAVSTGPIVARGGALLISRYYQDVTATFTNTVISGNTATEGSAIYSYGGDIVLINSTVSGNLGADAAIRIRSADDEYSAVGRVGGDLTLTNTDVVNNVGDGVRARVTASEVLTVVGSDISGNTGTGLSFRATYEGGTYTSAATIINSRVNNNARGVELEGYDFGFDIMEVTIQGSQIKNNTTGGGLALLGTTEVEINETTISDNHNTQSGGGIVSPNASYGSLSLEIRNSTISGNSTDGSGGGISFDGPLTIEASTISGNSAYSNGGGISFYGYLTVDNSTISGNNAQALGGGLWLHYGTDADIRRSTIASNMAGSAGGGVVLESAPYGSEYGSIDIAGSIIANNTAPALPDLFLQDSWTINYSLVENPGSVTIGGTGNIVGVDPLLGPLQNNGGPAFTHALPKESPAIDAGDPAAVAGVNGVPLYDQRGEGFDEPFYRVFNGRIDMGAYESQSFIVTTELDVVDEFDGLTSLREAILYAEELGEDVVNTEIEFSSSLAGETIVLTQGVLVITTDVTIIGLGADLLTIDGGNSIFYVDGLHSLEISGLTLTGVSGGPVIDAPRGYLRLQSCKITGNQTSGSIVRGTAVGSPGGYIIYGYISIDDCEFTNNQALGIITAVDVNITGTTISNNTGRAVNIPFGGELEIIDSTISGNTADKGAGIYLSFDEGSSDFPYYQSAMFGRATITDSVISGNTATQGSAIFAEASSITLIDSTVSGNLGAAAAIIMTYEWVPHGGYRGGRLTLNNSDVINNAGDGIRASFAYRPDADISDSDISGNSGTGLHLFSYYGMDVDISNSSINNNARGLYLTGFGEDDRPMSVTIQGSEIKNSTTGGGLVLPGGWTEVEIIETTISGNHNTNSGGGIYNYGIPLSIRNSTISGNTSDGSGGGIFGRYGGLKLQETTVSGNSAIGDGGGIFSSADIIRSTIANNSAGGTGGGLYTSSLGTDITGSIIANNTASADPDITGPSGLTINYSLIENPDSTTIGGTGNIVGLDPMLGPLQDNGGPTFTHALLAGSPAIDAGDPDGVEQRLLTPNRIDSNSPSLDYDQPSNLVNNSGLSAATTIDNYTSVVHAPANSSNAWQTISSGGDYFAAGVAPILVFEFFEPVELTDLVVWGYPLSAGPSNNEAKSFEVRIGSTTILLEHQRTAAGQETLSLGQTFLTDRVQIKFTDNHFGTPGGTGGNRVGMGEVKFIGLLEAGDYDQRGVGFPRIVNGRIDMGSFEVQMLQPEEPSLVVTTEQDVVDQFDGLTSLREAIGYANSLAGADEVTFDAGVFGTAQTISLLQGELLITDAVTISGTGANMLTIDAGDGLDGLFNTGDGFHVFNISDGDFSSELDVAIYGLTITGADVGALGSGGGIRSNEHLILTNCDVSGNATVGSGGGVYSSQALDIVNCTISNNQAGAAGGVGAFRDANIVDSTISGNVGVEFGGGITSGIGTVNVIRCTISGNQTNDSGGGIENTGILNISFSTISGNTARSGAGVKADGATTTTTISNCTISENEAEEGGGGIDCFGNLVIASSTITGNSANNGGGIYFFGDLVGTLELYQSIVSGNSASTGREVYRLYGLVVNNGYNFLGHSGITNAQAFVGFTPGATDITATSNGTDPTALTSILDTTLADNGGSTLTHALVTGSPAIDAGDPAFTSAPQLLTPTSVTSITAGTDFYPAVHLINNSGLSASPTTGNYTTVTHASATTDNAWVSAQAGGPGTDYFDFGVDPVLTFQLGEEMALSSLVVWGYALGGAPHNNEAQSFTVEFSTDGGVTFGNALQLEHARTGTEQETLAFGQTVVADAVRLTITDNYFGAAGASGGGRVGLSEVKFLGTPAALLYDQRGVGFPRVVGGRVDIGAFEVQPLPSGDFDGDGDVDGRDFLRWQRGQSPSPLSSGDLALWQEQYGESGGLRADHFVVPGLEPENSQSLLAESREIESGSRLLTLDSQLHRETASDTHTVFEDSYVEEVDRALEQLATVPSGVRSFGEMVARRGVKRLAHRDDAAI